MTHRMTDEEYDNWLRSVEVAAAAKEEDTNDNEWAQQAVGEFLDRYYPVAAQGKISRRDLYEMLTRSRMLRPDSVPRPDFFSEYNHSPWAPDKDSDHRRSARKD